MSVPLIVKNTEIYKSEDHGIAICIPKYICGLQCETSDHVSKEL